MLEFGDFSGVLFVNMSCWRKTDFCEIVQSFVICFGAEDTFDDYFEHGISTQVMRGGKESLTSLG